MADYLPIDEVVYSDAELVASSSALEITTYALPPLEMTEYAVRRVMIARRARKATGSESALRVTVGR